MTPPLRIGLLGCGTVGAATVSILQTHGDDIERRAGASVEVARVAVRSLARSRGVALPPEVWTTDPLDVVRDPNIDVVVEVIGGVDPARELILEALRHKKHVVTANKELLSSAGQDVLEAAESSGVDLLFEAAVGGGIPIIRPLKQSLAGDRVKRVMGIVNGTTNFILTRMSDTGEAFPEALAAAERLGYAEADPSADIEGFDAAAKLAILASIAFNARVVASDVHREGIASVRPADIVAAHDLGYEVKLLAVAERHEGGEVSARVHPAMVPRTHPLATVRDVFNAVFVEAERAGELMFFGRGAGGGPTASAVVGDVVEVARNITSGGKAVGCTCYERTRIRPPEDAPVRYYTVLSVVDQPGVLAQVAQVFAVNDISIASVRQEGRGNEATLALITHTASEGSHRATFGALDDLGVVKSVDSTMRVEGDYEE